MKGKLTDDERWLWTELAHSSFDVSLLVRPRKEASDFRALETVLHREILRLTWWRYIAIVFILYVFGYLNWATIDDWVIKGFSLDRLLKVVFMYPMQLLFAVGWMYVIRASSRWRNGVELAVHLSQSLPARSTVELLMTVLKWDEVRLPLNKESLAPVLYRRLADVLMRVEDWKPNARQRKLLQRIALSGRNAATNEQRYPDALRVAALVTLADEPAALDEKFRARISTLSGENSTEASVKAAMDEVLRRF